MTPEEEARKTNLDKLKKAQNLFSEIEELIPRIREQPSVLDPQWILSIMDGVYRNAIDSFLITMYNNRYQYNLLNEDDFAKIKPMYDKWKTIIKNQKIDDEVFEDFKTDLNERGREVVLW